jgi:hypothetical protein
LANYIIFSTRNPERVQSFLLAFTAKTASRFQIFSLLALSFSVPEENYSQRSDSMQALKSRKYQGSKGGEGRLKLSTACTECHKRKQKVSLWAKTRAVSGILINDIV